MPGSSCIDGGTNAPPVTLPDTDFDGNPRALDGDGDGNSQPDMGAYEYDPDWPSIAVSQTSFTLGNGWPELEPESLLIRNCGGQVLHWQVHNDCNWLEIEPMEGISVGEVNEILLRFNPDFLGVACRETTSFALFDANATNSPVSIHVALDIPCTLYVPTQYETIQAAIDAAEDLDTVVVSPGRYTGQGNRDLDFKGKAITVQSIDPSDPNVVTATVIDCNGTQDDPHRGFHFHS
jgi:hypothetical protein